MKTGEQPKAAHRLCRDTNRITKYLKLLFLNGVTSRNAMPAFWLGFLIEVTGVHGMIEMSKPDWLKADSSILLLG